MTTVHCCICLFEGTEGFDDFPGKGTEFVNGASLCPDHTGTPLTAEVRDFLCARPGTYRIVPAGC